MGQCSTVPMATDPNDPQNDHTHPNTSNNNNAAYDYSSANNGQENVRQSRDDVGNSHGPNSMKNRKPSYRGSSRHMKDDATMPMQESTSDDASGNSTTPLMNAADGSTSKRSSGRHKKSNMFNSVKSIGKYSNHGSSQGGGGSGSAAYAPPPTNHSHQGNSGQFRDQPVEMAPPGAYGHNQRHGPPRPSPSNRYDGRHSGGYQGNKFNEPPLRPIVLPPEDAIRTRCYRLNLDLSPFHPAHAPSSANAGPMECSANASGNDMILYSNASLDESVASTTSAQDMVSTAKIFRGLTIHQDGTVVSMHSRKSSNSRSSGNNKGKDEKSRQAAKIDKAKDLVEEAVRGQRKKNASGEEGETESNMVSLVIIGEYDDMKHLVRDGARRLKESTDMPDDTLLAMNRTRSGIHNNQSTVSSPMSGGGYSVDQNGNPIYPMRGERKRSPVPNSNGHSPARARHKTPLATPPKLSRHPRDRPNNSGSSRRDSVRISSKASDKSSNTGRSSRRFVPLTNTQCSDIPIFGGGDSDWSEAIGLSKGFHGIWNCGANGGAAGTASPNSVSPTNNQRAGWKKSYGEQTNTGGGNDGTKNVGGGGSTMANEGREPGSSGSNINKTGRRVNGSDGRDGASTGGAKDTILV